MSDDKSAFGETFKEFEAQNPNVKIDYVKKDSDEYFQEALDKIASGQGPDILAMPNTWLSKNHDKLVSMPDNMIANPKEKKSDVDVYKESYPPVVAEDNIYNEKIYGMPLAIDTLFLYFNGELMNQAMQKYAAAHQEEDNSTIGRVLNTGPKNWDEFVQAVRVITEKDGSNVNQSAVAIGTADNVLNAQDILTAIMLQNGAKMTSDDLSTAQFHTKQNVFGGEDFPGTKALEFYAGFANPDNDNYTWNNSFPDSLRAFAEGKTAMFIGYSSQESDIKRINPDLTFEKIGLPQIKETENPVNYASYLTFTVTKAAKDPNLAWNFINFMTNIQNASQYISQTHKTPALLAISGSDEVALNQAKTAKSWYIPDPEKTKNLFLDMIKQVNDGKNAQTAIENAASQVTTLLDKLKQ